MKSFFILILSINCLFGLEQCHLHKAEIWEIRDVATEATEDAHFAKGHIFNTSSVSLSVHDMAERQFRYKNSYSQFVPTFSELMSRCDPPGQVHLINGFQKVSDLFFKLYTNCIQTHGNILAYYERGKIFFDRGYYYESVCDIRSILEKGFGNELVQNIKEEDALLLQCKGLFEIAQYEEAIELLTKIINKNPQNLEAYYTRAISYFETGNFELALMDYVLSDTSKKLVNAQLLVSDQFYRALLQGLKDGGFEAAKTFIPSCCSTVYGLGLSLWSFGTHPVNATVEFANTCHGVCHNVIDYLDTIDKSKIIDYAIELQMLYNQYADLGDAEKGAFLGYCIGKYGVEFFAFKKVGEGIAAFNKLKESNRICTMESMLVSEANTKNLTELALIQYEKRQQFFKNVKLHVDKQNKHVPTAHNYLPGRSILTHKNPQELINKHAGTGIPTHNREFGKPDYREKVNFGEVIGYHIEELTGVQTETTFGEIRYASDGTAHIVPVLE